MKIRKGKIWGAILVILVANTAMPLALSNQIMNKETCTGNILVAGSSRDEYTPAISADTKGNILVIYTKKISYTDTDIYASFSLDSGINWYDYTQPWANMGGSQFYPSLSFNPSTDTVYGGFVNGGRDTIVYFKTEAISNVCSAQESLISFYRTGNFKEDSVACLGGGYFAILSIASSSSFTDTLCVNYIRSNMELWANVIYYDAQSVLKTAPASNISAIGSGNHLWLVFQHYNEITMQDEVGIKWTTNWKQDSDIEFWQHQMYIAKGDFDARDPDIAVINNNPYVVYMSNEGANGDFDIICKYSIDGETWEKSIVASTPQDEKSPCICAVGDTLICSFVREGNLYVTKSTDGGITWWEEPIKINEVDGTVVDGARTVDLTGEGIVWTDNRNGNMDVYFSSIPNLPPLKPMRPSGPTSGKIGEEYSYNTSTIELDGDNIYYLFDWGDGYSEWLGPYKSGEIVKASHVWENKGSYEIKVKAKDEMGHESEWSDPLAISIPRSYENLPYLWLEIIKWLLAPILLAKHF